jgi:hypothetical protein
MNAKNKKICKVKIEYDENGSPYVTYPEEYENDLFQTLLPRMPEYKIIKLPAIKHSNSSHKKVSKALKELMDEQGVAYTPTESVNYCELYGDSYYIVDEIGELIENNLSFENVFKDPALHSHFHELCEKVEYYNPLYNDTNSKHKLFYDAMNLNLEDNAAILDFCNKYGQLFIQTYYYGSENHDPSDAQIVMFWDMIEDENLLHYYRSGKMSLKAFRNNVETYQNITKLWTYCNELEHIKSLTRKKNGTPYNKRHQNDLLKKYNSDIKALNDLYNSEFNNAIDLSINDAKQFSPDALQSSINQVKRDIVKKINYNMRSVQPEIYIDTNSGESIYKFRFLYKNLIEALYLILFNFITDNHSQFFICKQCGNINELVDRRGSREYCPDIDKHGMIQKGHSECKRRAEEKSKKRNIIRE